jgi:hypothetical protein
LRTGVKSVYNELVSHQEVIVVLPKACGGWYHLPVELSCNFSPALLLEALGGRNGLICKHHPHYWHWRPACNWVVRYHEDGFVLFDEQHRARLDFSEEGEKATLRLRSFHRYFASCEPGPAGWSFVHAYAVDPDGNEVYRTFSLHNQCRVSMATLIAAADELMALVTERMPDVANPFAYW